MNERIATLLFLLSRELSDAGHESRCSEPATKRDLHELESRLTKIIQPRDISDEEKAMLDDVLSDSRKIVRRLEKLDQATPSPKSASV